jgi:hypothetical protein
VLVSFCVITVYLLLVGHLPATSSRLLQIAISQKQLYLSPFYDLTEHYFFADNVTEVVTLVHEKFPTFQ